LHPRHAQYLRNRSGNTGKAHVRPAGEIQQHVKPDINIGEALRASGEMQRNTIRNFILDLRGEALVASSHAPKMGGDYLWQNWSRSKQWHN
jgi:hypothetical protein